MLADCLDAGGPLDGRLRAFEERRFPWARLVQDVSRGILQAEMGIDADNYDRVGPGHARPPGGADTTRSNRS